MTDFGTNYTTFSGAKDYKNLPQWNYQDDNKPITFSGGTSTGLNTLDTLKVAKGMPIDYDRDELSTQIAMLLEAHNHLTAEQLSLFCQFSPERLVRIGATDSVTFGEIDPAGIPTAKKVYVVGSDQGWPLRRFGVGTQWNQEYWTQKDMRQFANQMEAILTADKKLLSSRIRRAFFYPTSTNFVDKFKDQMTLPVKPLINGDGASIPPNAYGTTFNNAAHTHYMYPGSGNGDTVTDAGNVGWATSTPTQKGQNLDAILANLREHYVDGRFVLFCNVAQAVAFTYANSSSNQIPGFQRYEYIYNTSGTYRDHISQSFGTYNPTDTFNRAIGMYDGVEVWVKPWVPANYLMCFNIDAPKPLQVRVNDTGGLPGTTVSGSNSIAGGDLRMVFEYQPYPLYAQAFVRDFDIAASSERQGAVAFNTAQAAVDASAYQILNFW